jgi:hypothetical protein
MTSAYKTAVFEIEDNLPEQFVIITAYNPRGLSAPMSRNLHQDATLQSVLLHQGVRPIRVIGRNLENTHREPGWGVELPLDQALEIAKIFKQDAIFEVISNQLILHSCEDSEPIELGKWDTRIVDEA